MTVTFEGYERRADKINKCLADNGIASLEEALQICTDKGFNRVRSSTTPSPSPSRTPSGPTTLGLRSRCQAWRQDRF